MRLRVPVKRPLSRVSALMEGITRCTVLMLAGWINRHQQDVTACLKEDSKILREKLGTEQILSNDNQPKGIL